MALEEQSTRYYDSITNSKNYIDSRLSAKIAVFNYLSAAFFGKDPTRLVYAEPSYAFRSRLEYLAKGVSEDYQINNLDLPFGSFWVSNPAEIIKPVTSSEQIGIYSKELDYQIHFFEVEHKMKAILWFHNFSDCDTAYNIALAESLGGDPFNFINKVFWRSKGLLFPNYVTITGVSLGNKSTTFSKFLTENKLHTLVLDLKVQTPQLHINRGIDLIQLPIKWANKEYADDWLEDDKEYFTQKCILDFTQERWKTVLIPTIKKAPIIEKTVSLLTRETLHKLDDETYKAVASVIPNRLTAEMVEAAFSSKSDVKIALLNYNETKTVVNDDGRVDAYIDFRVHKNSYQYWKKVTVVIPGHPSITLDNCKQVDFIIPNLHPNSNYTIHLLSEDISGTINDIPLSFTTPKWSKETLMELSEDSSNLSGDRQNDNPKDIPMNGLIGLDDDWTGLEL